MLSTGLALPLSPGVVPSIDHHGTASSKSTDSKPSTADQQSKQVEKSGKSDCLVICTNVPESGADSLEKKQSDDLSQWDTLCHLLGVDARAVTTVRLHRPKTSSDDRPRLLRVKLESTKAMREVLLHSSVLRHLDTSIRIYPYIPWEQRQRRHSDCINGLRAADRRAIYLHGVPESLWK